MGLLFKRVKCARRMLAGNFHYRTPDLEASRD